LSAALGLEQLHGHQANQTQARDHHGLAQRGLHQADALQRYGAQHRERGGFVGHRVGHLGAQVHRHGHHFCVLAVAGHAVAHGKTGDARAHFHHFAHVAVAHGQRLVQLVAHGLDGGHEAVGADLVQHHAHLVGLLPRLVDEAGLAEVHQHALRAGRDQRARGADQQLPATDARARHFGHFGGAVFEVLQNLFHGFSRVPRQRPPARLCPCARGS
jgi:hypothetical protein